MAFSCFFERPQVAYRLVSERSGSMSSQYGQDYFVLEVLGGMRDGFFLDSGASDGVQANNTLLLEASFGWRGICIEPNDTFFAALVRNRRCCCLNCCLYDQEGTVDFLEKANTLGGILGEYHPAHLRYAKASFRVPEDANGRPMTVRKAARSVRSVLRECAAPPVIDYWSLDTEGSELAILKSFPFDEYSFRVLTVEHNWLPVRDQIREFLESHGYHRIKVLEIDDCYVKGGNLPRPSWRSNAWTRFGKGRAYGQ
jgi:methyltransferase FkbM-like protein